jgi:hypothetical protein
MEITINKQYNLYISFSTEFQGRGQWNLVADVIFKYKRKLFTQRVFADFIDELIQYKHDNNPSSNEIDKFCNDKSFQIEEDDRVIDWCQEVEKEINSQKTYDVIIENAHEYFGNLITSDELITLIENEINFSLSKKTKVYFVEKFISAQLDWDNADEKESEIITRNLAELIADNIL